MVRFIINMEDMNTILTALFTFQYGQIYYVGMNVYQAIFLLIYIPIWLDLLFLNFFMNEHIAFNLHSNMVRFIINMNMLEMALNTAFTFQYGQIYYQLLAEILEAVLIHLHSNMVRFIISSILSKSNIVLNLHSNMVRFIINNERRNPYGNYKFTFQYGQIYYNNRVIGFATNYSIYIPIWLDLLCPNMIGYCNASLDLHSNMVRFIIYWLQREMV